MATQDWIELKKSNEYNYRARLVKKDGNTFMFATGKTIHEYTRSKDEWKEIQYNDKSSGSHYLPMDYDPNTKKAFILNWPNKTITIFDMEQKKSEIYPTTSTIAGSSIIRIGSTFHVIGGCGSNGNSHKIWNDAAHTFETIHTDQTFSEYAAGLSTFGLVFISKRKEILLLGGFNNTTFKRMNEMYNFSIMTQKWTKLNVKLPKKINYFGHVITKDQRYIIILGGLDTTIVCNEIFIFDLKTQKFIKSKIKLPFSGFCNAIIMENKEENNLLVNGFVRKAMNRFNMNIPFALIKLITIRHSIEYVHVMSDYPKRHWEINVDKIFKETKE